jgi:hypothetical protein
MEVIEGVLDKNLLRKPDFPENRHIEICTLCKGLQKILPLPLIVFSGYKLKSLSKTSKQYC